MEQVRGWQKYKISFISVAFVSRPLVVILLSEASQHQVCPFPPPVHGIQLHSIPSEILNLDSQITLQLKFNIQHKRTNERRSRRRKE